MDFFGGELDERIGERFHGTVHVALYDYAELFEISYGDTAAYLFESNVLLSLETLDAEELVTLVGQILGLALIFEYVERFTCGGSSVQPED